MTQLGIYVQVPFCQTKCTYCNFHTGVVASAKFTPYVDAVCREIREHRELYRSAGIAWPPSFDNGHAQFLLDAKRDDFSGALAQQQIPHAGRPALRDDRVRDDSKVGFSPARKDELLTVDTVYIGGGTPSLLDPNHLKRILDAVRENFPTELREVTLEADPETIEPEKAAAWREAGINRISCGVQSFADRELIAAGRMHRRADIYRAAEILRNAGISNISFDLIAGLPHQTKESWQTSLDELLALAPPHVSVYLLEIDEGSRLGLEVLQGGARYSAKDLPSEDDMAGFYERACEVLGRAGYRHYEISNWCRTALDGDRKTNSSAAEADQENNESMSELKLRPPNSRSLGPNNGPRDDNHPDWMEFASWHNLKYWKREPYLGFGAGAHSFSGTQRWANAHDAAAYVQAIDSGRLPAEQLEGMTQDKALEEELFLGMRQLEGIDVARIEREYGVAISPRFERLVVAGLVEKSGSVMRLAPGRLSVSNEVFVELMR